MANKQIKNIKEKTMSDKIFYLERAKEKYRTDSKKKKKNTLDF